MYVCMPKRVTKLTDAATAEVVVTTAAAAAAEATLALTCERAALQLKSSAWGTFSRMPTFHGLSQTLRRHGSQSRSTFYAHAVPIVDSFS